jgi:hypothetical protein
VIFAVETDLWPRPFARRLQQPSDVSWSLAAWSGPTIRRWPLIQEEPDLTLPRAKATGVLGSTKELAHMKTAPHTVEVPFPQAFASRDQEARFRVPPGTAVSQGQPDLSEASCEKQSNR